MRRPTTRGSRSREGEVVVLLNNDTVVPPGLMGRLAGAPARATRSIGLLCPTTNFCGNEARVEPDYAEIGGHCRPSPRAGAPRAPRAGSSTSAWPPCTAWPRGGPSSTKSARSTRPTASACSRTTTSPSACGRRGYRVVCAEDAYVHHVGQGAFRKLSPEAYDALWKKNQAYFEKKFGVAWKAHARARASPR